jgi:hypothetical protein
MVNTPPAHLTVKAKVYIKGKGGVDHIGILLSKFMKMGFLKMSRVT